MTRAKNKYVRQSKEPGRGVVARLLGSLLLIVFVVSGCTGKFVKVNDDVGSAVQRIGDRN